MSNPSNHAPFLADLLGQARKGSKNLAKKSPQPKDPQVKLLTAEELAQVSNILDRIGRSTRAQRDQDLLAQYHLYHATTPIDINGNSNYSNNPVFFLPHGSKSTRVPGVPHAVSDINHTCNKCTRTKCLRHRTPSPYEKTSVSLCTQNHTRLALWWDICDVENRSKTWRLSIGKHSDIPCPQQYSEDNELKRCQPHSGHMKSRIELLAKRVIEDYNAHQKDLARRAYLDPRGREYYTRRKDWGGRDPFMSVEWASARKAHEFEALGASRVEMEIRVLLQACYRGQLEGSERGFDGARRRAMRVWGEKRSQMRKAVVEDDGIVRTAEETTMKATLKRKYVYASEEDGERGVEKEVKKRGTSMTVLGDSNDTEIFEQLADAVVATETGADEKSGEVTVVLEEKRIVEKRKTATPHMPTAQEFKLLQRIKQAQDDASESEEEDEVVDEPEEDDDLTEPEAPQQKADDNNKDTPYTPKIPTPSPSSPHSSSPLKRKARTPSPDI